MAQTAQVEKVEINYDILHTLFINGSAESINDELDEIFEAALNNKELIFPALENPATSFFFVRTVKTLIRELFKAYKDEHENA
jgi:hypothetical protein